MCFVKSAKGGPIRQYITLKVLSYVIPFTLGLVFGWLLKTPLKHETDFIQGILTASSVLVGLSGVLLGIVRFPRPGNIAEEIVVGAFKVMLILSLLLGILTILLSLSWYAKGNSALLQGAVISFGSQLGYLLVFLLFPKYYLR
jgi:hypothetical protein